MSGFMATAETDVAATAGAVWAAQTEPDRIAAHMCATRVETTWEIRSPATWNNESDGRRYQDNGKALV